MSALHANVSLRDLNTLRLQSKAAWFVSATSVDEVQSSAREARAKGVPLVPLGGGSNVILGPEIAALVVHVNILGREVIEEAKDQVIVRVGAGESWHETVLWAHQNGYYGLENLALIPGSVGAAPVQNIGAYGVEVENFIAQVNVVDGLSGESETLSGEDCGFGYRNSVFKREGGKHWVITSVDFRLSKRPVCCIEYPDLRKMSDDKPVTPASILEEVVAIRTRKLPDPNVQPNVGSFFKNPIVSREHARALKDEHDSMPQFPVQGGGIKLSAAWMIDYLGWRGVEEGGVRVADQHALVLINESASFAPELVVLVNKIRESVKNVFNVELEIEPQAIALDL